MAWTNPYEAHHLEDREKRRTRKGDGEAPLTKTNKKPPNNEKIKTANLLSTRFISS